MADQYSGDMIVELMRIVNSNRKIPRPEVEKGGLIVNVDGVKWRVGPEVIEAFRQIEAEKRQANASGKPSTRGHWQTQDKVVKSMLLTVAREAGFPDLFD